jgi:hypothetical protein
MAVQSIWTPVQERDIAGDHLFMSPREMAFREMDRVREVNHLAKEVWARAETLDDAGNLRATRARAPVVVCCRGISGGFVVFCDADLGRWFGRLVFAHGAISSLL